jgi:hypothetical protein
MRRAQSMCRPQSMRRPHSTRRPQPMRRAKVVAVLETRAVKQVEPTDPERFAIEQHAGAHARI